jgi:hypothetical protein
MKAALWGIPLVAVTLAMSVPIYSQAAEEEPIVKLINDIADKPANHQAIAVYYRTLASEAREDATKHKAMRGKYRHDHPTYKSGQDSGQAMAKHCDKLIKNYESTAEEYEALAKLHEAQAAP